MIKEILMKKNAILLALLALPAFADDTADIERITVSGDFRTATLDQLSASASVLSGNRLDSRQATYIDNVLSIAPNVNFAAGASRGRFIQIRGIGERSQFAEPINPSVSFLVDDFDFSGLAAAGVLFDTQQVEVYRGPQATVFGTGALAGAVKIVSNAPSEESDSHFELSVGNKSFFRAEGAHGGQASDSLAWRAAFVHNSSDGFIENDFLGADDTNGIHENAVRLGTLWDVTDKTSVAVDFRWYDINNGYDAFSLDNNRHTLSDEPGFDEQETKAVSAHINHETAGGLLEIIATMAGHDIAYGYDEDWTYTGFHPWGYTSFDAYYRDVSQQSAEVRFTSAEDKKIFNDTTTWVIGGRINQSEQDLLRQYTYADGDFISTFEPQTTAVYGQLDTQLTPSLLLTSALRVENYAYDYADNAQVVYDDDTTMTGGKLALTWDMGGDYLYASVSRGYKGAGINYDEQVSRERRFFDAEYNWNYEAGYKGKLFVPELTARAAVFFMEREDTQISDFDVQEREDGSAAFIDITANADVGTNKGAELELSWQATSSWTVQASAGYLSATFEGYETADGEYVSKQRQAQAPKYTANLFSELWLTDSLVWRADMDFKDEYRFSDGHDETAPATTLYNTDITWVKGMLRTTLWVKNVFDKTWYTRGFGGFSNDPRDYYEFAEPYYQLGDGRQFGVTARFQF